VFRFDIVHEVLLERTAARLAVEERELLRRLVWVAGRAPERFLSLEAEVVAEDA
jgi:hypothetical protein